MNKQQETKNQKIQIKENQEDINKGLLVTITEDDNILNEETIKILKSIIGNKDKKENIDC